MSRLWPLMALLCVLCVAGPARAQQGDDGLDLVVDTRYELRPDQRDVFVTLDVVATNTLDDAEDDFGVTRFFFDEAVFAIPVEADDVTAADAAGELQVGLSDRPGDGISEAAVAFRSRLYSAQEQRFSVTFRLPATPARSDGEIRVDRAFGWFFLWAYGDPGGSSVTAVIPGEFRVRVIGDPLQRTSNDVGDRVLVSGPIEDPLAWVAVISARNDGALATRAIDVEGASVKLRSWPSDPAWADGVESVLREGLPKLNELIGRPLEKALVISESIEPSIHGYGGWYLDSSDAIELGEELDPHLVLHEVSHAWFNDQLFTDRWIREGLADVYADAVVDAIGGSSWEPAVVSRGARGSVPLNHWMDPTVDDRPQDASEDFAYAASWMVVDTIVGEIGFDAMAEVFTAAWTDTIAYRGDAELDLVGQDDDWRRFLDLLEQVGGSTEALSQFDTWVVDEDQRAMLDERYRARAAYNELEQRAATWALPPGLRRAMSSWDFDLAEDEIAEAEAVIRARDRLQQTAAEADLVPVSLEPHFEAGDESEVLVAELEADEAVAGVILEATGTAAADRSVLEEVGLLGAGVEGSLDEARELFAKGDLGASRAEAAAVIEVLGGAERQGRIRGVALACVLIVVLIVVVVMRRRTVPTPEPSGTQVFD